MITNPDLLNTLICCPFCRGELQKTGIELICQGCGERYPISESEPMNLRLRREKSINWEYLIDPKDTKKKTTNFCVFKENQNPDWDYQDLKIPRHLSKGIISYIPKALAGGIALDLGCGDRQNESILQSAGYQVVSLDYGNPKAQILGDAHALPFKDTRFDFVISIAVMEHVHNPFLMCAEAERVLKHGGKFLGIVAFQQPFHGDSYLHHSHFGTMNVLKKAGLEIEFIMPNPDYPALPALAKMALFPGGPLFIPLLLVAPLQFLHKLWWRLGGLMRGKNTEKNRLFNTAGSFIFLAKKL